nr:MAG TPA: hypothetical protein [Caudoviricetes sp.]
MFFLKKAYLFLFCFFRLLKIKLYPIIIALKS